MTPPFLSSRWQHVGVRLICPGLVVGLYVLSFFLPVLRGGTHRGAEAFSLVFDELASGNEGMEIGSGGWFLWFFGFLPNPLLWIGTVLLLLGRWRLAAATGAVAVAGTLTWMFNMGEGSKLAIDELNVGYFCWLASMVALAAAGLTVHRLQTVSNRPDLFQCASVPVTMIAVTVAIALSVLALVLLRLFVVFSPI